VLICETCPTTGGFVAEGSRQYSLTQTTMPTEQFPKIYLYRRIVQAKLFIDSSFADNINLDDIADESFFSKFHFMRLFKTTYGKTPHQYLTWVRIEEAKLLLQTSIPIAQVCFSVGFDSVSSFTGLFKRITGMTPSFYQQQQLVRREEISNAPLKFIPNCFAEKKGWTEN
jgi:AraC-like DNA-binding protein